MVKRILKKIAPKATWNKLAELKLRYKLYNLKRKIISCLSYSKDGLTDEEQEVLDYLKHNPLRGIFPYEYTKKYSHKHIQLYISDIGGGKMCYILQDSKRLYFKRDWGEEQIRAYYNGLLIEQDAMSPHRYEASAFHVHEGDVVVDAGAAEGNFALSVIDKVKKIYLFEVDETWIEALNATFAPWKDKVAIVNKYVSDSDKKNCVTLDAFLGDEKVDFIKADIEGAERQLLAGAKAILSRQAPIKVALCAYHKHDDAEALNQMLIEKGFCTEFSRGYMIFWYEIYDKLSPPYLRRGLVRAIKKNTN
jgi:hypothetical protein